MINTAELITFGVYFVFLMIVGVYFYRKTDNIEDYLLGGRGMGKWVTALSAQASDMSGWLLMGLPGAVLVAGISQSWIAIGLFIGTMLNWILIAKRLRVYTAQTDSLTLPSFFESRFRDPSGLLRILGAIITLFFFTIYASSGLVGAGLLFESMFAIPYTTAVLAGGLVIVLYTFLGGFLAVCYSDLFQGALMLVAVTIVPILAYFSVGGSEAISAAMVANEISGSIIPAGPLPIIAIISTAAWGLGYFGQPHILARFMSIGKLKDVSKSTTIAGVWVVLSLGFAIVIGIVGIGMFPELAADDSERVFILMIREIFNPWIGGILLAAILSAIMSTIDSQLLVSSSSLTEDFYLKILNKEASKKELFFVGRLSVVAISLIAMVLAMNPRSNILGLVSYAWGGFGAAFGPLIIMSLFSRKTTWQSALAGMLTGTIVLVLWEQLGWGAHMYEIVPGFLANILVMIGVNHFLPQQDEAILSEFDMHIAATRQ
ncbi:sodium/proline symporter PutP [Spirochaeta africana]|uniref:Sodium/proline symporter n=1 Tax=Spirochaeta africana (strain ATCC 700263 / DSM 8902 / Z-7692) TaxID=889378 RepID=H9UHM3_SPIAZ|nr:sodium/proline symporter PutP [Spirochaeta africana]AFG37016.1 sodium/proline symporter [Spirochaeta africana DSM 8902]